MELDFDVLPSLIALAILFLAIYISLYYKYIYSILDPLFIFIITTAFASVLVTQVIPEKRDIYHYFGCQFALWLGFAAANKFLNIKERTITNNVTYYFEDELLLRRISNVLLVLYIVSNLFVAYTKGFTLLSDAPTTAKVENFQGGFGIFRKVKWSVGTFITISYIFLYLRESKKRDLLALLIITGFTSLDGSKGAFLGIILTAAFIIYHPAFQEKRYILKKLKYYSPLLVVGILGVFFTVLLKENDGYDRAFLAFFIRLLYSGDAVLFFYTPVNIDYFANFSPWDYSDRLFNPLLGFFRLQPYKEALGNVMVENLRPPGATGVIVGPNTPFYIEGRIYFGFWGAILYSALIGYTYALFRIYYFSLVNVSAFYFNMIASFCILSISILTDINLAITQMFDLAFFTLPAFVIVSIVLTQKIIIHPATTINYPRSS